MRYQSKLSHAETPGGYPGAQTGSGQNSDEQERESWNDNGGKTASEGGKRTRRNDSDGNSNVGASNEFNTEKSRKESEKTMHDANDKKDLRKQLDNGL